MIEKQHKLNLALGVSRCMLAAMAGQQLGPRLKAAFSHSVGGNAWQFFFQLSSKCTLVCRSELFGGLDGVGKLRT